MRRIFLLCTALLASGVTAFSYTNVLENGDSQTITNGWDAGGDMVVGDATSNNVLIIVSGGSLTNVNAYVGQQASASNNTVDVSGSGAEWINTGTLQVGAVGNSNNAVSVSNGGTVDASNLVIHADNDFNLNNGGTLDLESGFDVSTNGFNWNAGGTLSVGGELTGLATTNEGTILSGEKTLVLNGGFMNTTTNLIVGYESSNNTLVITNGGTTSSADGYIGWGTNAANNSVLVSDSGSAWTNSGNLYVGVYGDSTNLVTAGAGNSLTVTNEAWVFVGGIDTNLTGAGGIAVGDGAEMAVGEGASVLTDGLYLNTNGNFELNGTLAVNHNFDAEQIGFNWNEGATLIVHSNLTLNADLSGTNQTLKVDGGSWNRGGDLKIDGLGNTLAITNGGAVVNDAGYVIGSNNTVIVSGSSSSWLNNGALNITNSDNSVTVESGGIVMADSLNITDGNDFYLNDAGTLAMTGDFDVSVQSNLTWGNGGNLSVSGEFSGLTNLTGGRVLTLDGSSALWDLANTNITVGGDGFFDAQLIATNGAVVKAANVQVDGFENTVNIESNSWLLIGDGADAAALVNGGVMVASTNGAVLGIDDFAQVNISETLKVGASSTETGTVSVANGGTLTAGGLEIFDTNSVFNLEGGGTLAVTGDFNAEQSGFNWASGGTLSVGGALTLDTLGGTNLTLEVGAGGTWDTTAADLNFVGTGNTLSITNGGQVFSASAFIGNSSNDFGNVVLVDGNGSEWNLTGSLWVNSSNTLSLASNGLVSVDGNMTVSNASVDGVGTVMLGGATSVFSVIGTNSHISTDVRFDGNGGAVAFTDNELIVTGSLSNRLVNFSRLSMTNSTLGGSGTVDGFPSINMSGGWIAPSGELTIDGTFVTTNTTLQVIAGADSLHVIGSLNLSGLLAEITITNTAVTSAFNENILTADGTLSDNFSSTNFIEHFLLYDFALTNDATTVSVVSEQAADGDIGATLAYGGIQGIRAGFNGMQNAAFVRTKQLRRNSVATDRAISHEAYLMQAADTPTGPQGPGDQNTIFGMHFWAQQFSGQGDYDAQGNTEGFTLNNNGTSFGFDKLLGEALAVGINYTYARSSASTTTGDRSDTETYWLGLYGEWASKNDYYLEGLLALGWSNYETVRTEVGYTGEAKFGGSDFGGHIEGGKYFHSQHWAMAPYVGLNYLGIKSDDYTETSGGNETAVDGQNVASLESALGMKLRNRFDIEAGRFQTVGYAEWAYDFINDDIGTTLSDGTISVGTARIAPGASLLNAGIGLSWICTDYLEVGVGYDGRFNENYEEHMGSIMLDVRF